MNDAFFIELQDDFLKESLFLIEQFETSIIDLENSENAEQNIIEAFRIAHSVKGGAAAVGFPTISEFAHKLEDFLSLFRDHGFKIDSESTSIILDSCDILKTRFVELLMKEDKPWSTDLLLETIKNKTSKLKSGTTETDEVVVNEVKNKENVPVSPELKSDKKQNITATSVKIDVNRLDAVLDCVGEIMVLKNQLMLDLKNKFDADLGLSDIADQLDNSIKDLYGRALSLRMTPLKPVFNKMQRIVRDLSVQLNKPVQLKLVGEETEIDRTISEMLNDPMTHIVRNAIDHGIESEEKRLLNNKNKVSEIKISATHKSGNVVIEVSDDGGGINKKRVFQKALEKKLIPEGSEMSHFSDDQIVNFILLPGFSTAEVVSDVSGRGVGLDVVKSSIEKIHGKLNIKSIEGQGTQFILTIPLTTAIVDGILVELDDQKYIIPTSSIKMIHLLHQKELKSISNKKQVITIKDQIVPIVELSGILKSNKTQNRNIAVIVEYANKDIAIPLSKVIGQTQAVIKSISLGKNASEFLGAAVLGDGKAVLILDIYSIISNDQLGLYKNKSNENYLTEKSA